MPIGLKIGKLVNKTVWQPDRKQVVIEQTLDVWILFGGSFGGDAVQCGENALFRTKEQYLAVG